MFQSSFGSELKGPFRVQVHAPDAESSCAMLVIRDAQFTGDFTLFRQGTASLAEFLAIGRAIVEQCEALMVESETHEVTEEELLPVVEHDAAMATKPENYF